MLSSSIDSISFINTGKQNSFGSSEIGNVRLGSITKSLMFRTRAWMPEVNSDTCQVRLEARKHVRHGIIIIMRNKSPPSQNTGFHNRFSRKPTGKFLWCFAFAMFKEKMRIKCSCGLILSFLRRKQAALLLNISAICHWTTSRETPLQHPARKHTHTP